MNKMDAYIAICIFLFGFNYPSTHTDQMWILEVELFHRFKEKHPDYKIGMQIFEMLKPFFCRRLKDRNTCCCKYHVQMSFLKDALNHMRSHAFGLHDKGCSCECTICATGNGFSMGCLASQHIFKGVTQLWESVLCPKLPTAVFHRAECLMGHYKICGVNRLELCCLETKKPGKSITVKVFAYVEAKDKHGNNKKQKDLLHREMKCWEFLELLKTKLKLFITHNYVA